MIIRDTYYRICADGQLSTRRGSNGIFASHVWQCVWKFDNPLMQKVGFGEMDPHDDAAQ